LDNKIIAVQQYVIEKSHSSLLHVMIAQMMKNAGKEMADLSAVAVAKGPGSYTGLRIGVSAAKGLCFALDIPLIGINTLKAMAYRVHRYANTTCLYCPMIDARRMEVFSMLMNDQFETVRATEPILLEEYQYQDMLESNKILFFGDGAQKASKVIKHANAEFILDVVPSAEEVVLLAHMKFQKEAFENRIDFEPFYLKEFRLATANKK
jgi:tRNA threonylcarbamoyladenosine biosynthesis protein TsaB